MVEGAREMAPAVGRRREGVDERDGVEDVAELVVGDEGRHAFARG
jgi:hypothetical protein